MVKYYSLFPYSSIIRALLLDKRDALIEKTLQSVLKVVEDDDKTPSHTAKSSNCFFP
jgi:hypothetical protein